MQWGRASFDTRLCLQSVVCYTLCRRCCKNEIATGKGKNMRAGRHFRDFRPDCLSARLGKAVNSGAVSIVHLDC